MRDTLIIPSPFGQTEGKGLLETSWQYGRHILSLLTLGKNHTSYMRPTKQGLHTLSESRLIILVTLVTFLILLN